MSYLSGYVHHSHVIAAWQTSDFDLKLDDNNIIILVCPNESLKNFCNGSTQSTQVYMYAKKFQYPKM